MMGMAQWEYKPIKSSGIPFFKFDFDVEDTVISAVCVESLLVDFDAPEKTKDVGLTFENGNAMYWSPLDKDGKEVDRAVIPRKVKYIQHHWSAPVCIYKTVRKVV